MMSKVIVLVLSLLGLISVCVAQVIQNGQCANLNLQANFDIERFSGGWYEYARTDNLNQTGECSVFNLTNTNGLQMQYSSVNNNFLEEIKGTATQDGNTARLLLSSSSFQDPIDFLVQQTNYDFFALTYSCKDISPTQRKLHVWVLTRTYEPNDITVAFINTQLGNAFGIELSSLKPIDHSSDTCYVLPVIEPGEPIIFPGQCDETLAVVQNFDVDKFLGLWHQISSYETPNGDGSCARAEYTQGDGVVKILNSQVVDEKVVSIDGYATVNGTDAKLSVVLNIPGAPPTPRELWILRSDYESYAVAYSCVNEGLTHRRVYSWILSRSRQLSPTAQTAVDEAIRSYLDLNSVYYIPTNQSDAGCFFYPEPSDQPVVFRGQCESVNVQALQSFEADKYMGKWHSIEMYPSRFQNGSCSNAYYELVDGNVAVLNSQVNDQKLETITGIAVPASDGSAKLVVTFPVPGSEETVSTDYWVLDTDYTSYAFVYTCQNLNDDEMQVSSWKLSRTKQLLPNSGLAIDAIMSGVPYLDKRFYKIVDQTEGGCFYFPEPQDNVPVVFPGQCDDSVAVLQNFNLADLEGTWYEIESYPKTERTGQCIDHQFTSVDTTRLNLVCSSVVDQFQGVLNGVVTRSSSNDNSGNLTIALTDANGQAKNVPFWILDANNDFIFAYGCENINEDYRAVWSWKLSRTRELSQAANTAISNAMEGNDVLADQYFEKIDHSNEACFYLPELDPGEPVILPGPCDETIEGIPNFNIEKYAGRWRLIESYGSDYQDGTCNVARYTQQGSNILAVSNSQVVNGQLASISGTATLSGTGKGQLRFYFPSKEESFDVTILDTDYYSYSLGYSCVNIPNNNQRRVYSWKMSRENTLSQDAINSINKIIDNIPVLNNRFYYHINRTDEGCFYLPTPDPNTSVRFRGQCEDIPVVTNFLPDKYLGRWFDIESYPEEFQNGNCNTAVYSEHPDSSIDVDVLNTQVINQALFSVRGSAVLDPSPNASAKLTVTFNVGGTEVTAKYWVLATDYYSYSLVYSCRPVDDEYVQVTSWKLSRTRELTSDAKTEIDKVMSNIRVLDQQYFIERNHSSEGCFYFPEPQPGVPVVFPGQCDESIAAVPNFNMKEFEGTWHEIAGYPKINQDGLCISQQFTVNEDNISMQLDSFSVLNLTQSTTKGYVTFGGDDDTSGKLVINSSVNGTESIPYWILSTDYTDYALAYSCINIDAENRGVWSWKLSRTRQLSDYGNAAIDNAILKVDVLRNDYYESIKQTDNACFHLPDITPGDSVVLPGQCDSKITGIPEFNLAEYTGEWRLIESYGSKYQSGTCNVAQYTQQDSNTLSVTNSQVVNELLASITGTATVSSTDGSGRLTFNLRGKEHVVYILDTDYKSFSLAYGCDNLDNDQRRVTSWKFSRSNTLSQAAINRINEIINDIEVLHQPYYYSVNRSPEACFYFPEPDRYRPVRFRGQCNESIPVVPNFNVEEYLGLWYDIESYPSAFQDGECPNALYSPLDSNTVSVYNTHVVDQTLRSINGLAVASSDGSAKLKVTFDGQNSDASDYWVLTTDYKSYAFVYSCTNIDDDYMNVSSWKLSRTRQLTSDAKTEIDNVVSGIRVLHEQYFLERDHRPEACFYFPEPQPGVPVVFPGQCDESIAAVPNFNMRDFEGTWHEIKGYPKANQDGQCISQRFTFNGTTYDSMRLDSFSVLDQAQSTTEGHVTFARDDDTSGKLVINIWVNGEVQSIPYWILSTNYIDYALVYSCVNIDEETRGVWSWKLSRTRELSDAGNVAINEAIAKVDVLDNKYYEDIQQVDSACFFYPELGHNEPVVFPGRCDPNIPVLQNFDPSRYKGRWRLIESYYSDFQNGTCSSATYTLADDGSVIVLNSEVVDEQLNSITGSAIADPSGNGKLTVTFPNSSPIEYWILDTDYDSYALIYTCVDLPNDERRVWSWKMSRSNSLTGSATNAIDEIMNRTDVLDARYYKPIDRTDTGCFYYPTPDSTSSVIFPGQCNESIPVLLDFRADLYAGTWYDVESYPTTFQNGTCNTAKYTLNSDGTLTVQNTQVVNQLLETVMGSAVPSTDGSAKLDVTITDSSGNDLTTKYWILATDYETYSFVYSCRNLNEYYREVNSWKLGKEPTIPEEAEPIINYIIDNVQVLSEQYYVPREHTNEACFYYPDNKGGDVIINGQCIPGAEVPVVTNFNAEAFSGVWHEVSRFPSELQNGECTSSNYNLIGANTFNIVQTSVIAEEKLVTDTQASVDTNGRAVISIDINGVPFDNVYILDTVYNDYALLYSCRNLDADRKQLYSWKLSRYRTGLSEAANNAINELVSTNIDLHEPYYRLTLQDNAACFYYPAFDQLPLSIEFNGPCNESIAGVSNFNIDEFIGPWYEIARYPQPAQTGQCSRSVFGEVSNSGTITVVNSQVTDEAYSIISGEATPTANDGEIEVTFIVGEETRTAKYYVLATDYKSYALLYSCVTIENGNRRRVGSWKLSRTTELSQTANNVIGAVISNTQGLRQNFYQDTSQTDASCFYYPEFEQLPEYIDLPGSCNASITGVANFDVNNFIGNGKWFEIARYPQPAQMGQCNLLEIENGDASNSLTFVSSQIFDESLTAIRGVASVASSDGSGNLQVTFNIDGETRTANYYVLATDYTSYALLYSCVTIENGNRRRVGSWKLSRTTELSQTANNVIDAVISSTQGLRQNFYQDTSQTDASCFYYPEFEQLPEYIDLPGTCNTSITGVANFDVNNFIGNGEWFEVARYPQPAQMGQCNRLEIENGDASNSLTFVSSQIFDESLTAIRGVASVASSDGSGNLQVTFNIDGVESTHNYFVLATDYTGFALLYTCLNNPNSNTRRVGSWKLSRNTGLSENAEQEIDKVIDITQGLRKNYYQETSHSYQACFHYPEQTGDRVVLPGQCDTDISAVESINVAGFANSSWYQIKRYDAVGDRSCIGTRLSLNEETRDIKVLSFEVVNEELLTIEGSGRLSSSDGSGKFSLVMDDSADGEETETTIYILATDYDGYALAYSCRNLNSNQRQVGVWQLSRERTMTDAGKEAIAELIKKRPELHEPYFKTISHEGECLEPSSAFLFKSSIILIFICTVLQLIQ